VRAALTADQKIRLVPATADWKQRITDKQLRAAVEIPVGFDAVLEHGGATVLKIFNYESELRSGFAVGELHRFFNTYREKIITARLTGRGLPAALVKPFEVKTENVAPPEKVGGNVIGGIIPYLFILLCFTGAMYPAIDLTAGEKERGTMETILCSPVGRADLVLGKFLMVLTAALGTVVFSLLSMGLTFMLGGLLFAKTAAGGAAVAAAKSGAAPMLPTIDPLGTLTVLAMVLPVAVLFSAVLMAVSLFAKSVKEAQSYVSPLIVVVILPAMMGMLPGVELNTRLALVPILNLALVSKELVSGVFHWHYLALIFGSTCVYATVALAFCVRMFNREDVLFRT
jgi:sodium transport system permease protein